MRKRYAPEDFENIPVQDWARLAAFIDGEGCITIADNKGAKSYSRRVLYLELIITNTDIRLAQWLQQTFGGTVYSNNRRVKNPKWAPLVAWNAASRHAAILLERCLPLFVIKREQAEVALAFQKTIIVDRRYGCKGRPVELIDHQYGLQRQLQVLKGTSSRAKKRDTVSSTIQ